MGIISFGVRFDWLPDLDVSAMVGGESAASFTTGSLFCSATWTLLVLLARRPQLSSAITTRRGACYHAFGIAR